MSRIESPRRDHDDERLDHVPRNAISVNVSEEFASMMEQLVRAWPVALDEVAIIAHSMGGLVARSACHYAKRDGHRWLGKLKKLVFLGTPHHGAPLERAGNWLEILMSTVPHSAPLARLGGIRSAGIKDPRHGNLLDEDWQGLPGHAPHDSRAPVPLPADVQCFAVAASLRAKSAARGMRIAGDGLVPVCELPVKRQRGADTARGSGIATDSRQGQPRCDSQQRFCRSECGHPMTRERDRRCSSL